MLIDVPGFSIVLRGQYPGLLAGYSSVGALRVYPFTVTPYNT